MKSGCQILRGLRVVVLACGVLPALAEAQFTQQAKLVGTGAVGTQPEQGVSVALSGNGNTVIVGGPGDDLGVGAAWVYTRLAGVWSQQGQKLVGTGILSSIGAMQGSSVALSADGNTAIIGGIEDNDLVGAAWVFTLIGGMWSQQAKLVGGGAVGSAVQGNSVALSADGNTAIIGGWADDGGTGARLGVHALGWCVEPTGPETGRRWCGRPRSRSARLFRIAIRRREYCHCRRAI
jgi:hypothetical protein